MNIFRRVKDRAARALRGELSRGRLDELYVRKCEHLIEGTKGREAGVVIVGANDGKFNDPIYDVLVRNADRTRVLAIEPQASLIPILTQNFEWHPRFGAHCGAVGNGTAITLYSVDPDYWDDLEVGYAAGWPRHRAPSGIASGEREHVEAWIARFLPDPAKRSAALREERVDAEVLTDTMRRTGFEEPVDVLQVDVEGFDDVVLFNSDLGRLLPQVIRFEYKHLDDDRRSKIFGFLEEMSYRTARSDQDCVAYLPEAAR